MRSRSKNQATFLLIKSGIDEIDPLKFDPASGAGQSPVTKILPDGTRRTITATQYKLERFKAAKQKKGRKR
jgi:hypothetical protein